MEKKLAEYRARKARKEKINELKAKTTRFFSFFRKKPNENELLCEKQEVEVLVPSEAASEDRFEESTASSTASDDASLNCCSYIDILYYLLWFTLWVILYIIFIEFQFGTVFLITSAIVFMYINTRTGPKAANEISAYSVFNKNCESIDGTLNAEQFEREIRYGPAIR